MISCQHCYLERDDNDKVWLYDTSSNGTYLNKKLKLTPGEGHQLRDGDKIYLVSYTKQPDLDVCYAFNMNSDENNLDDNSDKSKALQNEKNESDEVPLAKRLKLSSSSDNEVNTSETDQKQHIDEDADKLKVEGNSIESENKCQQSIQEPQSKNGVEEALQCSLCMDILYDPVSLVPCMHCYCATCYCNWMQVVKNCPQCRANVDSIARNHVIKNLVEAYMLQHPEKQRSKSDIEKLLELNSKVENMLSMKTVKTSCHVDYFEDHMEYNSSDLDDDFDPFYLDRSPSGFPFLSLSIPDMRFQICRQCSGESFNRRPNLYSLDDKFPESVMWKDFSSISSHVEVKNLVLTEKTVKTDRKMSSEKETPADEPDSKKYKVDEKDKSNSLDNTDKGPGVASMKPQHQQANPVNLFRCSPTQIHIKCSCCFENMPDRRTERITNPNIPPQSCTLCNRVFCHMYWTCRKAECYGCLEKFGEINFGDKCLPLLIMKNTVESRVLMDYLESHGLAWRDLFKECMTRLDSGQYKCPVNINSSTVLCYTCGLKNFRILAYSYRFDIPQAELPGAECRPDCYWGKNCRTQSHKVSHAMKYNHICEQTRT